MKDKSRLVSFKILMVICNFSPLSYFPYSHIWFIWLIFCVNLIVELLLNLKQTHFKMDRGSYKPWECKQISKENTPYGNCRPRLLFLEVHCWKTFLYINYCLYFHSRCSYHGTCQNRVFSEWLYAFEDHQSCSFDILARS